MVTVNRTIVDPIGIEQFERLRNQVDRVLNAVTTVPRLGIRGDELDPRRSISDECGYLKTEEITLEHYQSFYERNPIAKKVVELLPNHTWKVHPVIYEDEDPEVVTKFEIAIKELSNKLRGESFYQDDEGDPVWEYLLRVDRLSGLGHYATLLIGVGGPEGEDLSQPLLGAAKRELTFLKAFSERLSPIVDFDMDASSPRFGLPEHYAMSFDDSDVSTIGERRVHWTRVIHVPGQVSSNEVFGVPRMLPVFNRLQDLDKLYGSSAEMYYRGAFPGISFETHPSLGGDVEVDTDELRDMVEEYQSGLQRALTLIGMHANSLAPQVVDPSPQINIQIEAICIEEDCPKRIFLGSEKSELASSQDRNYWDGILQARRNNFTTPKLLIPTIDRFIQLGILPTPKGFSVQWPEVESMSPLEKADIAIKITQAIITYVSGGGEQLVPVSTYLTMVLGFTVEEAKSIVEVLEDENREMILDVDVEEEDDTMGYDATESPMEGK